MTVCVCVSGRAVVIFPASLRGVVQGCVRVSETYETRKASHSLSSIQSVHCRLLHGFHCITVSYIIICHCYTSYDAYRFLLIYASLRIFRLTVIFKSMDIVRFLSVFAGWRNTLSLSAGNEVRRSAENEYVKETCVWGWLGWRGVLAGRGRGYFGRGMRTHCGEVLRQRRQETCAGQRPLGPLPARPGGSVRSQFMCAQFFTFYYWHSSSAFIGAPFQLSLVIAKQYFHCYNGGALHLHPCVNQG